MIIPLNYYDTVSLQRGTIFPSWERWYLGLFYDIVNIRRLMIIDKIIQISITKGIIPLD
jgi:hypothetical protein